MKRARFTEEQIIATEGARGAKTADLARKHGISEATLYLEGQIRRDGCLGGKRLRQLEDENAKLKKLLAEQILDAPRCASFCQEMVGPAAKREAVAYLQTVMDLSECRACQIVGSDPRMVRYRSRWPPDTELCARLRDLANERRRCGYNRLFVLLRWDGEPLASTVSSGSIARKGFACASGGPGARRVGTRAPILVEARPNARWSVDFVHDQFAAADASVFSTSSTM